MKLLDIVVEGFSWNFQSKFQDRIVRKIIPKQLGLPPSRKGIRRSKKSLLLLEGDFHGSPFALMPSAHVIQTHAFRACHPNTRNQRERAFRGQIELSGSWEGIPNTLLRINKTRRQKWEKKKKNTVPSFIQAQPWRGRHGLTKENATQKTLPSTATFPQLGPNRNFVPNHLLKPPKTENKKCSSIVFCTKKPSLQKPFHARKPPLPVEEPNSRPPLQAPHTDQQPSREQSWLPKSH